MPAHVGMDTRQEPFGGRPGFCGGWIRREGCPRRRARGGRGGCEGPGRGRGSIRPRRRSRSRRRRWQARQGRGSGEPWSGEARWVAGGQTGSRYGDGGAVTTRSGARKKHIRDIRAPSVTYEHHPWHTSSIRDIRAPSVHTHGVTCAHGRTWSDIRTSHTVWQAHKW